MKNINFYLLLILCFFATYSKAQVSDSVILNAQQLPEKYYSKVDKKLSSINEQLSKKSVKYLTKFQKRERKIQERLQKLNAESVVENANEKYKGFSQKIKNRSSKAEKIVGGEYSSYLDSLGTSLSFLKQFKGTSDKVKKPMVGLNNLEDKLQQSEKIKVFIAERKGEIKDLLSKYTKIPPSLKKEYDKFNKTAYYYSAQIKEYKDMLKDPDKIERKTLSLLNKLPPFQKFMKENSQLASLFRIPGSSSFGIGQEAALAGLQTRSSVQSMIQERIAAGGPNAQAQIQQNLAAAHAELNKLKDNINQLGSSGGGDPEMPNFKPNSQKTKSFLKRLEYTADVQFGKTNRLLPSTANIGLGIGYKLNDKSTMGVALAYKMGMGTIQNINITHQGIGLRSYADYKIKGAFFISGGYEMNYNAAFKNIEQLKDYNAWQRSALIGVSKKYKINKKLKGEMKLVYDILAREHIPISPALIFRAGYKF